MKLVEETYTRTYLIPVPEAMEFESSSKMVDEMLRPMVGWQLLECTFYPPEFMYKVVVRRTVAHGMDM